MAPLGVRKVRMHCSSAGLVKVITAEGNYLAGS